MESFMQLTMQSQNDAKSIDNGIGNGTSNGLGNSHTPYSILHTPAERLESVSPVGAVDNPSEPTILYDVLDEILAHQPGARHPRTRIGERDEIPLHVRLAVWFRDRGLCAECPQDRQRSEAIHMDHIIPWSAGGADTTDNLRVLCKPHNLERSNYIDGARPKRPATWWCHRCHDERYEAHGRYLACPRHSNYPGGPKSGCRPTRASWRWEDASWFMVPPPVDDHYPHIAYCAHCDAPRNDRSSAVTRADAIAEARRQIDAAKTPSVQAPAAPTKCTETDCDRGYQHTGPHRRAVPAAEPLDASESGDGAGDERSAA